MNLAKKIVSVAAGVALVAGMGAVAATPATAKDKAKIKGATGIAVPTALVTAAAGAGVAISPVAPATADATMDVVDVLFPVTGPLEDGVLHHKGGLSLASSVTNITLTVTKPTIEWPSSGGSTASIVGEIGGIPADNPFAGFNGQRLPIFTVTDFVIKDKAGKIKKNGKKGYTRVITSTLSGDVSVVDSATVVDAINGFMGVPLFTAGMDFGTLSTKYSVTRTCKTKKACK